jgi:EmrB/QacA subfamily drug resistance transporter
VTAPAPAPPIGREAMWSLVATCVAVFAVAIDFTAPTVALSRIERDLDSDLSTVQWVLNGYSLTLAVLIVVAGRLADMHGRRRLFFIGAGVFAVASLGAALAPGIGVLLTARVVMATGAALMWPAVLGMAFQALPADRRALAGGLVIGVAGVGNAFGPLIGGALTQGASWRLVFAVNIPLALLAIWLTRRYVHQPFERAPDAHLDPSGGALLAIGLVALLLALDFAADGDLARPISLALLGLFAVMLVAFVAVERRVGERALVPRDVMADRRFRATCVAGIFMSIPLFVVMLFLPQYFSKVQGYGAFEAGVALLPLMVSFALTSFIVAANTDRVDPWLLATIGAAAQCVGMFMLSFLDSSDTYISALGGMVVLGVGIGLFNSVATAAAVTSLDESRASLGGAVLYMFQVAGGTVGLALTTAVFALVSHQSLQSDVDQLGGEATAQQLRDLQGVLAGTESSKEVQLQLPSDAATEVAVTTDAFDAGLQWAFRLDGLLVVAGVGVTAHMARSQRRQLRVEGTRRGEPAAVGDRA